MNPELEELQEVIQGLHQLMVTMKDPNAVNVVAQCLRALTGLQKEMMTQGGGAQGGPPGGPQQGPPPQAGGNPQQALLQQLLAGGQR